MPVINGVYTKDFPALGRAPIDTDIIPIAEVANQITYKTTIGEIFNAKVFGTAGAIPKFTSGNTLGDSIITELSDKIGIDIATPNNKLSINSTDPGSGLDLQIGATSYARFGIINPGVPGEPGVDNDCFIGSTINNDFLVRTNNIEALRIDTAQRLTIANIQNALADTDKFLVSEGGVVKYRTGAEVLADIGGASATGFVPYTGATSDVDLGLFDITATALIKAGGVDTQFLKADGSVDNNTYLTANDLPSTLSLYATNVPASVSGYFKLVTTIDDPDFNTTAVDISTGAITTTDQLIASLVSPTNLINGNPGVFNVNTYGNIKRVSGSGSAEFFFRIYKRDSAGVETLVGTSSNSLPVTSSIYTSFFSTAVWNDGVFTATDSIVIKYYGVRIASGTNPTYNFQFGGDIPVRTIVPIPTAVIPNIFLEQLADVEDGTASNNDGIFFDSSVSLWKYKSVSEVLGYTPVSGTGTANYIPKFNGTSSLTNSTIYEDAGGVAIGTNFSVAPFKFYVNGGIGAAGNSTITGNLTASQFIVPGGTSSQFLKADGSVDTTTYQAAISLAAIGITPNANGASLVGSLLNLQPANASFGGVVTTGTQTFAGDKTFSSASSGQTLNIQNSGTGYGLRVQSGGAYFQDDITIQGFLKSVSYTYTLPSATGTLALTSNLSAYLPLAGGTLTGALNGTSATFSGAAGVQMSRLKLVESTYSTNFTIYTGVDNSNSIGIYNETSGVYNLKIASTGAATFSGLITGQNSIYQSNASGSIASNTFETYNAGSTELTFKYPAAGSVAFSNGTTRLNIDSNGNTAIGYTTNPSLYKLDVNGTGRFSGDVSIMNPSGDISLRMKDSSGNADRVILRQGTSNDVYIGDIDANGGQAIIRSNGENRLTIASTGAATFASSVSVNGGATAAKLDVVSSIAKTNTSFTRIASFRSNESLAGEPLELYIAQLGNATSSSQAMSLQTGHYGVDFNANLVFQKDGGNVGIGNTGESVSKLYISGSDSTSSNYALMSRNTNGNELFYVRNDKAIFAPGIYDFTTGSGANVVVFSDGSMQRSTSSIKYKKNIENYTKGLKEVMQMRPVTYNSKNENETQTFAGLIAEEIHDLGLAEFVQYAEDGSPDALSYSNMVSLLVKAIQELNAKITQLENK
jgi:hypothetical protein